MPGHTNAMAFTGYLARKPYISKKDGKVPYAKGELAQEFPFQDGEDRDQIGLNRQVFKVFGAKHVAVVEKAWEETEAAESVAGAVTLLAKGRVTSDSVKDEQVVYKDRSGAEKRTARFERVLTVDEKDTTHDMSVVSDAPEPKGTTKKK